MKPGRNDPCPCGSGKKYKHCCSNLSQADTSSRQTGWGQNASKEPTANEQNHLIALYQAGRYAELESQAGFLLRRYPDSGFGWRILSAALAMQGKDALQALQQTAKLLPRDAEVHNNLGDILAKRDRLEDAERNFRKAIQIKPKYADAYYNLGHVLFRQDRFAEAADCFKKAIHSNPNLAEAYSNLGATRKMQGLYQEAEANLCKALQLNPGLMEAHINLGDALAEQGRTPEAETRYRHALTINPHDIAARFALARIKKVQPGDEDFSALLSIERMACEGQEKLSGQDRIGLHFALGKCLDDIGEYDQAFPHFEEGCRLKRASFAYDPDADSQIFAEIQRIFDATKLDSLHGGGDASPLPIFILGMPRSGTTLIEQIIASHPDVQGAGELPDLMEVVRRNNGGVANFWQGLRTIERGCLAKWGAEYVAALKRHSPGSLRVTDKMPHNFLLTGLIHVMLPNARIIHVRRNPLDTCLSCFTNLFGNDNVKFSYDLTELGRHYAEYARLMEHWRNALPKDAYLDVQYEDVVQDREAQTRRLIEYCGLEWNDACLEPHKSERSVRTASVSQIRQPIYRSSMDRSRNYERHLGPLLEALGELVPNR